MLLLLTLLALYGPPQPVSPLREGLIALEHGQLTEARHDLEQARSATPENALISGSLAEVYWRSHEPRLAQQAAQTAERLGATDPIVAHVLAIYYSEAGNIAQAAKLEASYAQSSHADQNALSRAASFYLEANKPSEAIRFSQSAAVLPRSRETALRAAGAWNNRSLSKYLDPPLARRSGLGPGEVVCSIAAGAGQI
ncbi:MAG: tetratricopeptide repeat protein [Bryobacteraceae bacterium]